MTHPIFFVSKSNPDASKNDKNAGAKQALLKKAKACYQQASVALEPFRDILADIQKKLPNLRGEAKERYEHYFQRNNQAFQLRLAKLKQLETRIIVLQKEVSSSSQRPDKR